MSRPLRHGIPPLRMPLVATALEVPAADARVTIIPAIPLVPVREELAAVVAGDTTERDIVWVDLVGRDAAHAWSTIRAALSAATLSPLGGDAAEAVAAHVAGLTTDLLLILTLPSTLAHSFDSALLQLLENAPRLSIAVIASGRRLLETLAKATYSARVVPAAQLVLTAESIGAHCLTVGLELSALEAASLARSPLALPHLLPAILSSALDDVLEAPAGRAAMLEAEAQLLLAMAFRASTDDELLALAPLAVPTLLTPSSLAVADPSGTLDVSLARAAAAGILELKPEGDVAGYRLAAPYRGVVLAALGDRLPDEMRAIDSRLAEHYSEAGVVFAAIAHFGASGNWAAAVHALDESLLRLLAEDPHRLHAAIEVLPRTVRDANPRFTLCLELGWTAREAVGPSALTITRRAAGTFSLLPAIMSPWDSVHRLMVKTMVLRLKADYAGAIECADELDELLDSDEIASRPLAMLAEAHYQSGLTRLLGLDLVGARDGFARSFELAGEHAGVASDAAVRAAGAAALVRALEGEAEDATLWLGRLHGATADTAGLAAHALIAVGRLDPRDARHWLARLSHATRDDELWPFAVHASNRYGLCWGDPVETDAELDRTWAEHNDQLVAGSTAQVLLTSDAADLALMLGHLSRAEGALDTCPARNTWIAASRARLALVAGNPKHALLFVLDGQARGRTERYGQLDLAVLRAAAELALGRRDDAAASLLRAINQSEKSGVIVPFRLLAHDTLDQLSRLSPEASDFVTRHELTGTSYLAPYQTVAGALSDRELVVLRNLDPDATVEQIAKKLYVASNTVKAQLRSIYRKLNVSTRTEAMLVAAELGLLDEDSRSA